MNRYVYSIAQRDGDGIEHTHTGQVESSQVSDAMAQAMREAYMRLTNGDTIYGQPGKGGCRGPYKVTSVLLTLVGE